MTLDGDDPATFDAARYRQVLGHYPTGVTVITAAGDGGPVGLAIGSFSSLSLDPPLVLFCPDRHSSSWPRIEGTGSFCVNVLAEDQEDVCRVFAAKGGDKFASIEWYPAPSGSPILEGALAWVDCTVERVDEAGDHFVVIGRVQALGVEREGAPLVFFRGGYGRFSP